MTYKEITDLLKLVNRLELSEFKLEQGETKMSIRTKGYSKQVISSGESMAPVIMSAPALSAPPTSQVQSTAATTDNGENEGTIDTSTVGLLEVKSPMVGTFYRSASPDKPAYVKVGDSIDVGSTVCIVEAMKLFNEIESEVSGKIVKVLLEDATPVEYDQVLFLVDPNG